MIPLVVVRPLLTRAAQTTQVSPTLLLITCLVILQVLFDCDMGKRFSQAV
jgi:hypothetical protein